MLTPSPEHNELHPYLAPHQNLELVYRTDYEARNSNEPLIPFPKGATLATYWFKEDKIIFFAESQWGILQIKPNKVKHTIWKSLDAIKAQAVNAPYTVQILGDLRSPIEGHTSEEPVQILNGYTELPEATVDSEKPRNAAAIADVALHHIKERAATYDSPEGERSALKTATAFNAVTGKNITEAEVFLLLQILKDVRQWQIPHKTHKDSIEDCIAYAALKAEAIERNNTDPFTGLF